MKQFKSNSPRRRPVHFAWMILLSCSALSGSVLGVIINCKGLFIAPICAQLGCSVSAFTVYLVFYGLSSAATLLIVERVFSRYPIRIVLTAALAALCGATAAMGSFRHLAGWYIAGAIQGVSGAFLLFVPVPMLIRRWFVRKQGFALGISATAAALIGAIMNPVLNTILVQYGWRAAYVIQGAAAFCLAAPFTLFIIRKTPEECGLAPYGADGAACSEAKQAQPEEQAQPEKQARPGLLLCCIGFAVIATFSTAYAQHFTNFSAAAGMGSQIGAVMVSLCMIGSMAGKTAFGIASDHWGGRRTAICSLLLSLTGFCVLIFGGGVLFACLAGALLLGVNNANLSVMVPLAVGKITPQGSYDRVFSKVTIGTMVAGAFSSTLIGVCYDLLGTYSLSFVLGALLQIAAIGLIVPVFMKE